MRLFATTLALGLITGCPAAPNPSKAEGKDAPKGASERAAKPSPDTELEFQPVTRDAVAPAEESGTATDLTPAWFDAEKIPHAKILQAKNQAKIGPNTATAMLLEMSAGSTPQDCISTVRTEMAKTIPDVVEPVEGDKGRMTLQGKTAGYSYTVVCGPGKDGQTTLYLSFVEL